MLNADALKIALDVIEILKPGCIRIEVKGSICRASPNVNDIEILAIPDLTPLPLPRAEIGKPMPIIHKTKVDEIVYCMKKKSEGGNEPWTLEKSGDKYKRFYVRDHKISVDLFLVTPPAQWGVQSVIRTGPSDFSHWMVTRESQGGALPDAYIVEGGCVGQRVVGSKGGFARMGEFSMPEEVDFFKLCGMEWIEPRRRMAEWSNHAKVDG